MFASLATAPRRRVLQVAAAVGSLLASAAAVVGGGLLLGAAVALVSVTTMSALKMSLVAAQAARWQNDETRVLLADVRDALDRLVPAAVAIERSERVIAEFAGLRQRLSYLEDRISRSDG